MTTTIRKAQERGITRIGWLDSRHTFSFGGYHDPRNMGYRGLRVINDDRVVPGAGFGTHPHRDMEIISYVVEGALEHQDSMGTGSVIRPGDIQIMSAGSGVSHSEFNHNEDAPVRFLQIWIPPSATGLEPRYDQSHFSEQARRGKLALLVDPDGREDAVAIRQDARIWGGLFDAGESDAMALEPGRGAWVQVVRGELDVNGQRLVEGDGVALEGVDAVTLDGVADAEVLVFDLA